MNVRCKNEARRAIGWHRHVFALKDSDLGSGMAILRNFVPQSLPFISLCDYSEGYGGTVAYSSRFLDFKGLGTHAQAPMIAIPRSPARDSRSGLQPVLVHGSSAMEGNVAELPRWVARTAKYLNEFKIEIYGSPLKRPINRRSTWPMPRHLFVDVPEYSSIHLDFDLVRQEPNDINSTYQLASGGRHACPGLMLNLIGVCRPLQQKYSFSSKATSVSQQSKSSSKIN